VFFVKVWCSKAFQKALSIWCKESNSRKIFKSYANTVAINVRESSFDWCGSVDIEVAETIIPFHEQTWPDRLGANVKSSQKKVEHRILDTPTE
jgi:hypothetical protein